MSLNARNYSTFLAPVLLLVIMTGAGLYQSWQGANVYWPGFIAIMFFYAVIFGMGIYASRFRKKDTADEVLLAGRSLPLFVAIFTMTATWVDGGFINGTAEYAASAGLMWVQAPWGYALSLILGGLLFARPMRRNNYTTMLDPLHNRFGKRMAAVLFLPALSGEIFWTAAILTALGTTFTTVLGVDFNTAIVMSAVVAIIYTSAGGLWAMAFTDVIQIIFIIVGLCVIAPFALQATGGLAHTWQKYTEIKGPLASPFPNREVLGDSWWMWWDTAFLLICGGIPWQVYFQRVLSSRSEKVAVRFSIAAGFMCFLIAIPAALVGIAGDVFQHTGSWESVGAIPLGANEQAKIFPYVVRYLMPPVVSVIGLGVVAAAVMSSVDASILSASSMASWNVWRPLVKPDITPNQLSVMVRRFVWIVGIAAMLLALQVKSVYALWALCSDFVYCLLFPQLVCALYDKKANVYGSIAAFAVGFIIRFSGGEPQLGIPALLDLSHWPFKTVAMVSSLVTLILVSRIFRVKEVS